MIVENIEIAIYKILAYINKCTTNGIEIGENELTKENVGLNNYSLFCRALNEIYKNNFVNGLKRFEMGKNELPQFFKCADIYITIQGVEYLKENSTMHKVKEILKDMHDITAGWV